MITTDHSPSTPDLKLFEEGDFLKAWGGISGIQVSFIGLGVLTFLYLVIAKGIAVGTIHIVLEFGSFQRVKIEINAMNLKKRCKLISFLFLCL